MNSQSRVLYLMRHAEVEPAYHRTFGGRIDMDISDLGVSQAQKLADYLKRHPFSTTYSSPMKRVVRTTEPHRAWTNQEPTLLGELREVDFGDWTGLKWEEVHDHHQQSAFDWLHLLEENAIANAEPIESFRGRIESALEEILNPDNGPEIGVFCHGGVIRMILAVLLGVPVRHMASFDFNYASVTVVHLKASRPEVQLANFCPWLH